MNLQLQNYWQNFLLRQQILCVTHRSEKIFVASTGKFRQYIGVRIFQLIIIWTTFLGSIAFAGDDLLKWEKLSKLPPVNGQEENPGVAGPFVGIHNDALIIAGGANFPGKPLWETDKVWHDEIYVLVREKDSEGDSYTWKDGGKLLRPLAYGTSVSTDKGVHIIIN